MNSPPKLMELLRKPLIPDFLASNRLNAFVLNSILLAFISVFASRLRVYETSQENKTFCLSIMSIYATLFLLSSIYYIYTKNTNFRISLYIPILSGLIFLTCLILYFTAFNEHTKKEDIKLSEKFANAVVSFFTTMLMALTVYFIMYKIFHFGGGLLINS